ncbi:MAG: C25 family cysteine peptidase [Planctomycetota bacterium]|nr:C25 family cysteine peptidase [Planctomycetota bacterium]
MRRVVWLLLLLPMGAVARAEEGPPTNRIALLTVRGEGPRRIDEAAWRALGVDDPRLLVLRRDGEPVTLYGQAGALFFAARGLPGESTGIATYELERLDSPGPALESPPVAGVALPREVAFDRVHGALPAATPAIYDPASATLPRWFLGMAPPGQELKLVLDALGAEPGTEQTLEVEIYGTWDGLAVLEGTWGDVALGRVASPDPSSEHIVRFALSPGMVPDHAQPLTLRNVSPPPGPPPARDVSEDRGTLYIDAVRLVGKGARLVPWSSAHVVVPAPAGARATPLATAGRAQHVIVATPPLLIPARRLAAHRTARGLPSVVVPVVDVYDAYGYGSATALALHTFLSDLQMRPDAPLRYVVLAGDATLDRTDIGDDVTIPVPMARTMYNGATPADLMYVRADPAAPGPQIGRLPFETAAEMDAYVTRLIRYEATPPVADSRQLLRFITSPGRFGAFIDGLIEGRFRSVLTESIPAAYDIAVTYADPASPYMWPAPEFHAHVVEGINDGALFFTYVGHGFAQGFDTLQVRSQTYPILHVRDAPRVAVRSTPPIVFVLACTTAMFDGTRGVGIGEALLRQPEGPIAYWGATRVCHPGFNALMGESIARAMTSGAEARPPLGTILERAVTETLDPSNRQIVRAAIATLGGAPAARLAREGAWMYALLGDPATPVALPRTDLAVAVAVDEERRTVQVEVRGVAEGTTVRAQLERPRSHRPTVPHTPIDASDPASAERVRANHAAANDLVLMQGQARITNGVALFTWEVPAGLALPGLVVKARAHVDADVHVGAATLP